MTSNFVQEGKTILVNPHELLEIFFINSNDKKRSLNFDRFAQHFHIHLFLSEESNQGVLGVSLRSI